MNNTTLLLVVLVVVLIVFLASQHSSSSDDIKVDEGYCGGCGGEAIYTDPPFPTFDHYGTNKWVRYDLDSDDFPLSPYYPLGPYHH